MVKAIARRKRSERGPIRGGIGISEMVLPQLSLNGQVRKIYYTYTYYSHFDNGHTSTHNTLVSDSIYKYLKKSDFVALQKLL